jgi:hypothetical protein
MSVMAYFDGERPEGRFAALRRQLRLRPGHHAPDGCPLGAACPLAHSGASDQADPRLRAEALAQALDALDGWTLQGRRRRRRRQALAATAMVAATTSYAVPICLLAGARPRLTIGVTVVCATVGLGLLLLAFVRQAETRWPLVSLVSGLLCLAGVGAFLIVEGALGRVLVGDEVATLMGLSVGGISLLLQALVTRAERE